MRQAVNAANNHMGAKSGARPSHDERRMNRLEVWRRMLKMLMVQEEVDEEFAGGLPVGEDLDRQVGVTLRWTQVMEMHV